jgi:Pterin 4 alpha carbinolamine dehydratase
MEPSQPSSVCAAHSLGGDVRASGLMGKPEDYRGNATVSLQTKKIKGLHENDFIMATKIDRIFARRVKV